MSKDEILARLIVLEQDVGKLAERVRELYQQILEDTERAFSPLDNDDTI